MLTFLEDRRVLFQLSELDAVEAQDRAAVRFAFHQGHYASWVFHSALGELRGVFGIHVAAIAAMHGLSVEDGLASILPAQDAEPEGEGARSSRAPRTRR